MERFSDAWLDSDELRMHLDVVLEYCPDRIKADLRKTKMERYRASSPELRALLFGSEKQIAADYKAEKEHPPTRVDVKRKMEDMLYRWEHGLFGGTIDYPGGIDGLREDLKNGKFG